MKNSHNSPRALKCAYSSGIVIGPDPGPARTDGRKARDYYIEDLTSADSDKFSFLWKKDRNEFFGDWIEATLGTLEHMKDLQRQITSAGGFMQELSMDFSHADNRINEYEDAMAERNASDEI